MKKDDYENEITRLSIRIKKIEMLLDIQYSKSVKENIKKMFAESSAHGIPNLVSNKTLTIKLIWIVSILASICGCAWFISSSVSEYFQYDVITNIKIQKVYSMEFPAVTFCAYGNDSKEVTNLTLDHIIDCRFSAKSCGMSYIKEIKVLQSGAYQVCLHLNSKTYQSDEQILKVDQPDWSHSLLITLDISPSFRIFLAVLNNQRIPAHQSFRYQIKPNMLHMKSIQKVFEKNLGKPYNDCIEEDEYFDSKYYRKTISKSPYYRDTCLSICFYENYRKLCNCTIDDVFDSNKDCGSKNECFNEFKNSFKLYENCNADCPEECKSERYNIIEEGKESVRYNLSAKVNPAKLSLFFPELKYTEIVQIPKTTVSNMVSSIGVSSIRILEERSDFFLA